MAKKKTLLILRLEGALQSWGEDSKWDFRDSADIPTKSGIVGLLGCALGLARGDPELEALSEAITVAVRADRAGIRAVDFQTVTGSPLLNAEGKPKSGGNTIISRRTYLQDACFTVFIETDGVWLERLCEALQAPYWPPYLGRKSCVPSKPVLVGECGEYASLEEAVRGYPAAERADASMVFEIERGSGSLSSYVRPDRKLAVDRSFATRRVWRGVVREESDVSV
jgi:CRISPR system Cascade subunit CasD